MRLSRFTIIFPKNEKEDILFNTLTGDVFYIEKNSSDLISKKKLEDLEDDLLNSLKEKKIVVEDDYSEEKIFEYFFNKTKYNGHSASFTILLTWACNFRCTYCYEGAGEVLNESMTSEIADAVVNFIINTLISQKSKMAHIVLFGGEPLLNIEKGYYILDKIQKYCNETNIILTCSMVSNGSLLTTDIIEKLITYNCKMIQITLDGMEETHNQRRIAKDGSSTFGKVLNAIKLLDDYHNDLTCVVRINVDKKNYNEIDEVMKIIRLNEIQHARVDFGIVHSTTEACLDYSDNCFIEDELSDILDNLWHKAVKNKFSGFPKVGRKWCYCGLYCDYNFTIAPNGDLYKCWEMVGDIKHKIGEIGKTGEKTRNTKAFFEWMAINPLNNKFCRECSYLPVCGGGCIMYSMKESGTYNGKACNQIKGVVENKIIHMLKKFEEA